MFATILGFDITISLTAFALSLTKNRWKSSMWNVQRKALAVSNGICLFAVARPVKNGSVILTGDPAAGILIPNGAPFLP